MSKTFAVSASKLALTSVLTTAIVFSIGIFQLISTDVDKKAIQLAVDESVAISKQEISNLMIASLLGEVANTHSDEKSIQYKQKADVVLASYQLNKPRQYYNARTLYSE